MYFFKPIADEVRSSREKFHSYKSTKKLILVAIFACIAAILQAAGGLIPGIGLLFSPLATAPILLCCMFSIRHGIMSYILTMMLLLILEPTELIIFPFTTGLLGVGIGVAFSLFRFRIGIIATGGLSLVLGIMCLLYIFQFPILGPAVSHSFSLLTFGLTSLFAFLYSWLWVEIAFIIYRRLKVII